MNNFPYETAIFSESSVQFPVVSTDKCHRLFIPAKTEYVKSATAV